MGPSCLGLNVLSWSKWSETIYAGFEGFMPFLNPRLPCQYTTIRCCMSQWHWCTPSWKYFGNGVSWQVVVSWALIFALAATWMPCLLVWPTYPLSNGDGEVAREGCQTPALFNTLRPMQNGRHFADDTFKCIFFNENVWILIKISLKFVPKGLINNIPALVQIMAWCRPSDKPLSEPLMVRSLTHICVTRPQRVNSLTPAGCG